MLNWDEKTVDRLIEITNELRILLKSTSTVPQGNWYDAYISWSQDNPYEFIVYLHDGFNEKPPKEILYYDSADSSNVLFFEAVSMSIFVCKSFTTYCKQTVDSVIQAVHPEKKLEMIRNYFSFLNNSTKYEAAITLLQNIARESGVLQGKHPVELLPTTYFFQESLEKYSVESIFLLFTYWKSIP